MVFSLHLMMNQRFLCRLLLIGVTLTCVTRADTDNLVDEELVSVTKDETVRYGKKVFLTRVAARDCTQVMTQSSVDNETVSDVFDDLENEVSVVLLAATPTYCYVRDITGAKARCQDGSFAVDEDQRGGSQETEYQTVVEMNLDDLPDRVAALCQGRTVLKVTSSASGKGGSQVQKRQAGIIKCVKIKNNCRKCTCVGWLFRKRTCQTCCDESEECTTIGG